MGKEGLHSGHRKRMIKRFLENGTSGMSTHELLEILLFYSVPRANTNETAHLLLERFRDLDGVFSADEKDLTSIKGVGKSTVDFLHGFAEAVDLYQNSESFESVRLDSDELCRFAAQYFKGNIGSSGQCMFISSKSGRGVQKRIVFPYNELFGDRMSNSDIISPLLRSKSRRFAVILSRSGASVPTSEDFVITKRIAELLANFKIKLTDVIICNGDSTFSMRNNGAFSFEA